MIRASGRFGNTLHLAALFLTLGLLGHGCSDSPGGAAAAAAGDPAGAEAEVDAIAVRAQEVIPAPISPPVPPLIEDDRPLASLNRPPVTEEALLVAVL